MKIRRLLFGVIGFTLVAGLATSAWFSRGQLSRWLTPGAQAARADERPAPIPEAMMLKLSPQARKNLGLVAKAAKPQTYWRTIQVPGQIIDRPGHSDRGVTSPAVGAVVQILAFRSTEHVPAFSLAARQMATVEFGWKMSMLGFHAA